MKADCMNVVHNQFMAQVQTQRPKLTISQAVEQFEVSRSTLKRGLETGRYPDAAKDSGAWRIPVEALHAEHKPRRSQTEAETMNQATTQGQSDMNQGHDLAQRVRELEQALAVEQAERRAAERVAEAEAKRAETAERALLMIEAGRTPERYSTPTPAHVEDPTNQPALKQRGGIFGLLKRNR